ncbi:hypothetical protein DENIS_3858 [Desulfonema ishimotonii]|uniref:Uncharacterized protein n=1 Tax=Desulfonema ishimotonii TaxID=45657 RepID=A0A401G0X0_9BACT|nr:hypothetical protein [Desulfonema ishimotonii]GBC62874.1 hypothetical protein DENIS_3858 [Desulfonema ishimotonii]
MPTLQPQGEDIRKAVKWIGEERKSDARKDVNTLVSEAVARFDLSPRDAEFLFRLVKEETPDR